MHDKPLHQFRTGALRNAKLVASAGLLLWSAAVGPLQAGGGKGNRDEPLTSSPTDAKCAFVRSLEAERWDSPEAIAQIERFALKNGMFFPAAHLVSYYADVPVLVEALLKRPAPTSKTLAAAILAFAALGDCLEKEKATALSWVVPEDNVTTGKQKGAGRNKRTRAAVAATRTIPAALFGDTAPATVELAVLAAAYAADASVKAQVDALPVPKDGSGLAGAKLLYHARLGEKLTDAQVAAAFAPARPAAEFIIAPAPALANFNLLLPKEAYACEAVGVAKDPRYLDFLHQMLAHPDLRVQIEAVRAVRKIASRDSLSPLLKKLETCAWPVLVEVSAALASLPAKESIPPLIARLKKETGRFRLDVTYALSAIAGEQMGMVPKEWEAWWRKDGGGFQVNEERSRAFRSKKRVQDMAVPALGLFYSMNIYSDHFSYVLDSSNSMKGSKMESLRRNMEDSINSLAAVVHFNITDFGGTLVSLCRKELTTNKRNGIKRVKEMTHSLGTRVYDAIEDGSGIDGVDTVFLLTDGMPTRGQLNRWADLYRAMTIMNRYRPLCISTIAFEPSPSAIAALKQMAHENYGLSGEAN